MTLGSTTSTRRDGESGTALSDRRSPSPSGSADPCSGGGRGRSGPRHLLPPQWSCPTGRPRDRPSNDRRGRTGQGRAGQSERPTWRRSIRRRGSASPSLTIWRPGLCTTAPISGRPRGSALTVGTPCSGPPPSSRRGSSRWASAFRGMPTATTASSDCCASTVPRFKTKRQPRAQPASDRRGAEDGHRAVPAGMTDEVLGWDDTGSSNNRFLASGRASMIVNAVSALRAIAAQDPALVERIALLSWPAGPAGRRACYSAGTYVIWRFSRNQEIARRFLADLAVGYREAFVQSGFYNLPAFPGAVPDLAQIVSHDDRARPPTCTPFWLDTSDWTTNLGQPGYDNAPSARSSISTSSHRCSRPPPGAR